MPYTILSYLTTAGFPQTCQGSQGKIAKAPKISEFDNYTKISGKSQEKLELPANKLQESINVKFNFVLFESV